ncbi:hypothetical protein EDB19DRAFT_1748181 [Suillus lakei]|nr:hypothetical protein EDB19DRAFT_1748181 [Suillus lakei]
MPIVVFIVPGVPLLLIVPLTASPFCLPLSASLVPSPSLVLSPSILSCCRPNPANALHLRLREGQRALQIRHIPQI